MRQEGERTQKFALALLGGALLGCQKTPTPVPTPLADQDPLVIPRPKQQQRRGQGFAVTPETCLVLPPGAGLLEKQAARVLQEALRLPIVTSAPKRDAIVLQRASLPETPQKPEGYALLVEETGVVVSGTDSQGLLWGAQTLRQLWNPSTRRFPGVAIQDWPSLPLRAVHLFHGQRALPFHQKLIDRVFSPLKLNALFLQVEQVRWNHDPTIAPTWAGTPEQVAQELAYARERGMTLYPLVQSFGHLGWLLNNPKNRAFAEDPATPYALCLTDPKAVAYLEGFLAEIDTLFDAPTFHVGLDEVRLRGRFPYRSRPMRANELFLKGARHWHRFFAQRGKSICLWADMALHAPEVNPSFGTAPSAAEAAKIRAGLPRELWLADWQYGEHEAFPSLELLKKEGYQKLLAASWWRPRNIQKLSAAAAQVGAQGLIQTTWCGYESHEGVLQTPEKRQFDAMVLAAEYFWNGGGPAPELLPYRPAAVFDQRFSAPS